ncbi:MAG: hypothetical protein ACI8RW_000687, partial [Porticoccaceae bacterium]
PTHQPLFDGLYEVFFDALVSENRGIMESYFAWLILPIQPFFKQLSGMLNSLNLVPLYSDPDYL